MMMVAVFPYSCRMQNKGQLKNKLLLSNSLRHKMKDFFSLSNLIHICRSSYTLYALFFCCSSLATHLYPVSKAPTQGGSGEGNSQTALPSHNNSARSLVRSQDPPGLERLCYCTRPALPSHSFIIKNNEPITLAFIVFRREKGKYLKQMKGNMAFYQ